MNSVPQDPTPTIISVCHYDDSIPLGHSTPAQADQLLDQIIETGLLDDLDDNPDTHLLGSARAWVAAEPDDSAAWVQIYVGTGGVAAADRVTDRLFSHGDTLGDIQVDAYEMRTGADIRHAAISLMPVPIAAAIATEVRHHYPLYVWMGLDLALVHWAIRLRRMVPHTVADSALLWAATWDGRLGAPIPLGTHYATGDEARPLCRYAREEPTPLTQWVGAYGDALTGWAVRTGASTRLMVIDLDRGHAEGVDGVDAFYQWLDERDLEIPHTLEVRTPRGGTHIWLRIPRDAEVPPQQIGTIAPGVDVITASPVPGPGSRKPRVGRYMIDIRTPIAECPRDLLAALTPAPRPPRSTPRVAPARIGSAHTRSAQDALREAITAVLEAEEGTRNRTLLSAAGTALHRGAEPVAATWALWQAAETIGLGEREIRATLRSALGYSHPDDVDRIIDAAEAYDPEEVACDAA